MVILKIVGIIFAALISLVVVALLMPVGLSLSASSEDKARFSVKFAGIPVFDSAMKKKAGKKKKTEKAKEETPKKKTGIKSAVSRAASVWDALKSVIADLKWLLGKAKITKLKFFLTCASPDAAQTALDYGAACSLIYPVAGYISGSSSAARRRTDVSVGCDFEAEKTRFEFDGAVSVRLIWLAGAALKIIFGNLKTITEVMSDGKESDNA